MWNRDRKECLGAPCLKIESLLLPRFLYTSSLHFSGLLAAIAARWRSVLQKVCFPVADSDLTHISRIRQALRVYVLNA